ncbi:hypothetical protein JS528_01580 [Bifidobacterium sp. MA2]|uniref:histidine kinase n=1 Tax=Bifidobacterium santillanense TaxID=2809028 RepID=A0ABS5UMD3_9BIFI|nr:hypothetical protein [Bifidobacterium santillanense]MBT1172072.1 hypothetical protein [Bifidobacterium santillanense]
MNAGRPSGFPSALRWARAHWFRLLIAGFTLVAVLIEWAAIPPVYPLNRLFCAIALVGVALSPFLPRASSWLILATVVARLFVLDLSGPNPLWATYLALAIIGYDSSIPIALGALVGISLAECVPVAMNRFNALSATWIGMVNYVGMFTFATMMGMALRWRRQRDEIRERAMRLERRQWELDTLRRDTRLASRIHDSASGGLSYIALTAQRQLRRIPDDEAHAGERADWRFVDEQARRVLDEIHHVIDLLEKPAGENGPKEDAPSTTNGIEQMFDLMSAEVPSAVRPDTAIGLPPTRRHRERIDSAPGTGRRGRRNALADAVRDAGARLGHLGFRGSLELRGGPLDDPTDGRVGPGDANGPDEAIGEAAALIGEIASNVTRHLDPAAGAYHGVVTIGKDAIEIMETNPIIATGDGNAGDDDARTAAASPTGLKPHGSGLALHRRIIARLGGELNTSAEDGDWVVYARIPLHARSDAHGEAQAS